MKNEIDEVVIIVEQKNKTFGEAKRRVARRKDRSYRARVYTIEARRDAIEKIRRDH
ncbi:MAG TPA: hypothetical protein VJ842_01165 [Pyrinomonadaceae bacterium]|nr:hypothetical protein [Pyrinomonadaceae bacterium]